jgi:putative transposase
MSRYRLFPAPAQLAVLREHCGHARYVWNLAVEQDSHWRPGRAGAPGYLARRFDLIRVEDLQIGNMTRSAKGTRENPGRNVRQKAGLNRGILGAGWGLLVRRLQDKAPGRVEKVSPAFTSQRCSACGQVDRDSRESQAVFRCTACGFACHADVNAAINIAAGHAVTARGGNGAARPVNREPQLLLQ